MSEQDGARDRAQDDQTAAPGASGASPSPPSVSSAAGLRTRQQARLRAQARQLSAGRRLATCGDPPPPALLRGVEQFNRREYFECHETLEALWNDEPGPVRVLYKGILQVGVGCYHLLRGNYRGAVIKLQTGAEYLEPFAPVCMSVRVGELIAAARSLRAHVVELGAERIRDVDVQRLPTVELVDESATE